MTAMNINPTFHSHSNPINKMTLTLTPLLVSNHVNQHPQEITELSFPSFNLGQIDDLSAFINLRKLNLSENQLHNHSMLGLAYCFASLTTLNLSHNQLTSCHGLDKLTNLVSLNISHNQISHLSSHILKLTKLKALVVNHNQIAQIENLGHCALLNTLVLSHNKITSLSNISKLSNLTKLSLSHNPIRAIPDLSANPLLKDLALNTCKITNIPSTLSQHNPNLELINLGNNLIQSASELMALVSIPNLIELILKGNPLTRNDPEYQLKLKTMLPSLRVLDGVRFDPRFLKNKAKRAALLEKRNLKQASESTNSLGASASQSENGRISTKRPNSISANNDVRKRSRLNKTEVGSTDNPKMSFYITHVNQEVSSESNLQPVCHAQVHEVSKPAKQIEPTAHTIIRSAHSLPLPPIVPRKPDHGKVIIPAPEIEMEDRPKSNQSCKTGVIGLEIIGKKGTKSRSKNRVTSKPSVNVVDVLEQAYEDINASAWD